MAPARPPSRAAELAGRLSPIGLGLAALGRPGYVNLGHGGDLDGRRDVEELERHTHAVLDAAWASGMRYVDAARSYGRAEAFLASWLAATGERPVVGSKWGYTYTAGWRVDADVQEVKEHTAENLDRQWAESRALLGDALDLYQIHSATHESGVLDDAAVLGRLAALRESGVLLGVTTSGPGQPHVIRQAVDIEVDGEPLFATVQSTWNLLEPSAGAALEEAADAGMVVIVKEAVANGRLTARNPALPPLSADHAPDVVAIAAALQQPWSTVVLSGAATTDQLASNLRALEIEGVDAAIAPEPPERYWATRSAQAWT